MFFLVIGVLLVILVVYALKDKVVEYIQWFKDVQHMRTLPGPPTEWGLGHMRMVKYHNWWSGGRFSFVLLTDWPDREDYPV